MALKLNAAQERSIRKRHGAQQMRIHWDNFKSGLSREEQDAYTFRGRTLVECHIAFDRYLSDVVGIPRCTAEEERQTALYMAERSGEEWDVDVSHPDEPIVKIVWKRK